MKQISPEETKKIEVEILVQFSEFCEQNSLTYMLAYGTLLGAVRHKGFIPWDDDIDLMMPRPDYDRLIELVRLGGNIAETIDVLDYRFGYEGLSFIKLSDKRTIAKENYKLVETGVWVDIFPLDGCFTNDILEFLQRKMVWVMEKLLEFRVYDPRIGKKVVTRCIRGILGPLLRRLPHRWLCGCLDRILKLRNFDQSELAGCVLVMHGKEERMERCKMLQKVKLDFEGNHFDAPACYDEWLTKRYGDYMTPPPMEYQESHQMLAYWKDEMSLGS